MKKLIFLMILYLCLDTIKAQQKTDSLLKEYKKIADSYQYQGKIDSIHFPVYVENFDTLSFTISFLASGEEEAEFYFQTRRKTDEFLKHLKKEYGKPNTILLYNYFNCLQWKNVTIDKFSGLTLLVEKMEYKTIQNEPYRYSIRIYIRNTDGRNALHEGSDTVQYLLNHFQKLLNSTIRNQPVYLFEIESTPKTETIPINYQQMKQLIYCPKEYAEISNINTRVIIDKRGKIKQLIYQDKKNICYQILNVFISKFQYPIGVYDSHPIEYQAILKFDFKSQKTDSLLNLYKKMAQNYQYQGKVDTIYSRNLVDSLVFYEGSDFFDNDNKLECFSLRDKNVLINYFQEKYGQSLPQQDTYDGCSGDSVYQWNNVSIDGLNHLNLKVGNSQNTIQIQVLDSMNINQLRSNSDTLKLLLRHFKRIFENKLFNQKIVSQDRKHEFELDSLPINYEQVRKLIAYPKEFSDMKVVSYDVLINTQGKIDSCFQEFRDDAGEVFSLFDKIVLPFLDKLQFPVLIANNQAVSYRSCIRFEFAPKDNSIEKSIVDTLNFYTYLDTFEYRSENYQLKFGNLFCKDKKHALLAYRTVGYETACPIYCDEKLVLYEYTNQHWILKQSFSVYQVDSYIGILKDYNWDGYNDVVIGHSLGECGLDGGSGDTSYTLFLYDPIQDCLLENESFGNVGHNEFEPPDTDDKNHVIGFWQGGGNYGTAYREIYRWNKDKLELIKGAYLDMGKDNEWIYGEYEVKNRNKIYGKTQIMNSLDEFNSKIWQENK